MFKLMADNLEVDSFRIFYWRLSSFRKRVKMADKERKMREEQKSQKVKDVMKQ